MVHLQRCKEWAIVFFCVWHMAAVGLFALPGKLATFSIPITAKRFTDPYMFTMSQWQYWSVFAPDPLRRCSTYRIELLQSDGAWQNLKTIDYAHLSATERYREFRMLENFERKRMHELVPQYLRTFCDPLHIPNGSTLRLVAMSFDLPSDLASLRRVATLDLPIAEKELGSATCL
jgi:hypothetical protein